MTFGAAHEVGTSHQCVQPSPVSNSPYFGYGKKDLGFFLSNILLPLGLGKIINKGILSVTHALQRHDMFSTPS